MNGLITIAGVVGLLLSVGLLLGAMDRVNFHPRWLFVAAGLVVMNDALLTNAYGLMPFLGWSGTGKAS